MSISLHRFRPLGVVAAALALLTLTALAAFPQTVPQHGPEQYRLAAPLFETGKQRFHNGEPTQAGESLRECLALYPEHAEANYYLARVLLDAGDSETAANHARKALDDAGAFHSLLEQLRDEENRTILAQLNTLRERAPAADPGDLEKIRQEELRLTKILAAPTPPLQEMRLRCHHLLGVALFRIRDYSGAAQQFQAAAALDPRRGDALKNLAVCLYMTRDFDRSLSTLERSEKEFGVAYPDLRAALTEALQTSGNINSLLNALLAKSPTAGASRDAQTAGPLQSFLSIYAKFSRRTELLTPQTIGLLIDHYPNYNIMADFIEKIPFRRPETVELLFRTARQLNNLEKGPRELLTAMFQAMLEIFSHAARNAETRFDYDQLAADLCRLPMTPPGYYDGLFTLFRERMKIRPDRENLNAFVFSGVKPRPVSLDGVEYLFDVRPGHEELTRSILDSQNIAGLETLGQINQMMDHMLSAAGDTPRLTSIVTELSDALRALPSPDISSEAPPDVIQRVKGYERDNLETGVNNLVREASTGIRTDRLKGFLLVLKRDFLPFHLKDLLVAAAYTLNGRSDRLKVFRNPNFVRLHDFAPAEGRGPWRYCGTPPAADAFSEYGFSGGLSRLNLAFAAKWNEFLFSRSYVYNIPIATAMLANILDMIPLPGVDRAAEYHALLIDYGLTLLKRGREDPAIRETLRHTIQHSLSGIHYRNAMNYLDGKTGDHQLYFTEIHHIGETFRNHPSLPATCGFKSQLEPFSKPPLSIALDLENDKFGTIAHHSFGNITPRRFNHIPRELSVMTQDSRLGGELFSEFKLRLAWHIRQKNIPPFLMGQILLSYLTKTVPRAYNQSHTRDDRSAYFIFEIFNNAIMGGAVKELQKQGVLRLK